MSKTADRSWARATTSRSFSSGASPLTRNDDTDLLEAVAVVVRQAERAAHVHVALERRLHLRQMHAAHGGDVDERGGQAGGQRVQQVLGRIRPGVGAKQDRRLAGVDHELGGARGVLLVGRVEIADRGAVVCTLDPAVPRPELEPGERRVVLDRVQRPEQLPGVDAVAGCCGRAHSVFSLSMSGPAPVGREQKTPARLAGGRAGGKAAVTANEATAGGRARAPLPCAVVFRGPSGLIVMSPT